jgi:hypothetical protein
MKFRQGDITMPVKTTIAAIAAFVAVAAAPGLASAKTVHHPTLHQRVLQLPADAYGYDAYGYVGSAQQVRPSQLTGGQGHDFQLEGRF